MVNITSAAHAAVKAYSALIALGGNYSYPLNELGAEVSHFFLPNYTSFTLGEISTSPNETVMAEGFISLYKEWREKGPGTVVSIQKSRVEVVSNESALCWLTYHIIPQVECYEEWEWTNVYGFRLVEGGWKNGLAGGWEFAIGDGEEESYEKNFVQQGKRIKGLGRCS